MSIALLALCHMSSSFLPTRYVKGIRNLVEVRSQWGESSESTTPPKYLTPGDRVLLIGPGFLQLNIAKAAKAAGLIPMIIAPQKKLDTFAEFVKDEEIMKEADIGLPDEKGRVRGVVFCSEEAVLGPELVGTVLDWGGGYKEEGPARVIACAPVSNKVNKERGMGWMPIFNNDAKEERIWAAFVESFRRHPVASGPAGTLVRFGSLLGGSVDGIPELRRLGLDERVYKMSLENYRDLKERSFDRFRLGAQILLGDAVNPKPPDQEKKENDVLKNGDYKEVFRASGGYPEIDRACRHTVAQAVVQALMRPTRGQFTLHVTRSVPQEFTVLSKCVSALPTNDEWDAMFQDPTPAIWPDPNRFDPSQFNWD